MSTDTRTWNFRLTPVDGEASDVRDLSPSEAADLLFRLVHRMPVPAATTIADSHEGALAA